MSTDQPTQNELSQTRLISGWMKKKGDKGIVKGWKNRWFQEKDDKKIYYYESRGDTNALGAIEIASITAVSTNTEGAFGFSVTVPGRVYYLQAFTEHDRQDWLTLLKTKTNLPLTQ
eukprot:TRINITY_DN10304_c0_g1_i1.p1 TRINITY_DN10304_c0_g1~~TRINITY_DN10304_c0_g1_i1.p1  ORF type:complete len:124 (-),score=16.66 TRINITY_DN10304_c0_g1_i1:157-504(-)